MASNYGSYAAPSWMNTLGLKTEKEVHEYVANVGGTPGKETIDNSNRKWRNAFYGKGAAYNPRNDDDTLSSESDNLRAQRAWLKKGGKS